MDKDYFEVECKCGYNCDGLIYMQPDVDKNRNRIIVIGADDWKNSVSVWVSLENAREIANKLLELAEKVENNEYN
jgi:hypothetical protein